MDNDGRIAYTRVMINDVRRAYVYAAATRDLYLELPSQDVKGSQDQLGKARGK